MTPYEEILETIRPEVSFGVTTIQVFRAGDLKSLQIGYSVSTEGKSLAGDKEGDWLKAWIVIAVESACGDPIFIDVSKEGFPVYTAMHGEGTWEAKNIAVSLLAFGRALSALAEVSKGRENPVALENNPLPDIEKEAILAAIRRDNPGLDVDFWEMLLTY
jgi:hypothetical protein